MFCYNQDGDSMNKNIRKEIVVPSILIATLTIAIFAGLTTYKIVEESDCKCPIELREFDVGTKLDQEGIPLISEEYTKGNNGYFHLIYDNIKDEVALAPSDYDKDNHSKYQSDIKEVELSDNLKIKSYNSQYIVKDNEMKQTITITDLELLDFEAILESGNPYCFVWMENNLITEVLLYGETIIYE